MPRQSTRDVQTSKEKGLDLFIECSRKIGNSRYDFYFPLQFDTYTLQIWTSEAEGSKPNSKRFGVNIYDDAGNIVEPAYCKQFRHLSWASSSNDWTAASFSLGDLEMILKDVQDA
mmetsp:Transcript_16366/g.28085  ORF Transcript_16366/g.28085 Transcript_16366/m.28085 type:complete len:115 (-) Transcript_16366:150-494(-)